ncbi:MAG: hypothetical protein KBC48_01660 [Candidatus Pacebacteria bacterium]|nr:hypothetical protein [Candidatus Paceibacterota bacterium]
MGVKILIIDGDRSFIKSWERQIRDLRAGKQAIAVYCNSVSTATVVIEQWEPELLLLGHDLNPGGHEGIEVVKTYFGTEMDIISIGDPRFAREYGEYGVSQIDKDKVKNLLNKTFKK